MRERADEHLEVQSAGAPEHGEPSASTTMYSCYDQFGMAKTSTQITGASYPPFSYSYNLLSEMTAETYPSGRTAFWSYDNAGRATCVSGGQNCASGTGYASSVYYAPNGAVGSLTLGNAIAVSNSFNTRFQMTGVQAGSLLTLGYDYGTNTNNGNLLSQTIARPGLGLTQTYGYDGTNRVNAAGECVTNGCPFNWSQNYGYDAFGNRWLSGYSGLPSPTSEVPQSSSWYLASNRINGWGYDNNGNILNVAGMSRSFTYDAENRQASASVNGVGTSYTYDGEGRRVTKTVSGTTTVFVYDAAGQLAAEYGGSNPATGRQYLTADALGSTRLVTDVNGNAVMCYDYLPFGEEIESSVGGRGSCYGNAVYPTSPDVVSEKFTGKERDAESGLDYFGARYMSSAQGRFTSPDAPFNDQDPSNPQSWNLYSYVRNNPLVNTDPTGQDCVTTSNQTDTSITVSVAAGSCGKQGGTFVNGTVDTNSLTYNGKSLDFGYTGYDGSAGAFSKNLGAPVYEFPGIEGPANQAGAAHIAGSQALINEFAKQAAFQALGGIAGHFIGAGIDAALAARAGASAATPAAELTAHAAQRLAQRGITRAMVEEAVETAQQTLAIKSNVGQYGTIQHVYQGTNGISVVVETEGRNADKVVTAFRTGSKP